MAQMVPDTVPSTASQGEKLVFECLKTRLPEDFIVWYEPRVKALYPDFIILGPDFGLLILEVKGWYAAQIARATSRFFDIRWKRQGSIKTETYQNPLRQGHGYFASIADKFKGYPLLCNPDGDYQGRLCFPVGVGAIMSNITEAQARQENLYVLLEQPIVGYRDELLTWPNSSADGLVQRLKSMFKVDFPFAKLTADQISTIKGLLHPEVAIKEVPASQMSLPVEVETPLPSTATVLLSLDAEQERLARSMKGGHRLISGVAGSGKTLILLARAKALANRLEGHRILILCFNITLARHLGSQLHSDTRNPQYQKCIEVLNFHEWARRVLGTLPNPKDFNGSSQYDQTLSQLLLKALQQLPVEQRWHAVLVDEAHTFSPEWFQCCVAALQDSIEGDLLIVSDGSQRLYKRRKFTWKSVGIQAQGRSQRLTHNYRNTQEILAAAWSVLPDAGGDVDETFPAVKPTAALRNGEKPVLTIARSAASSIDAAVEHVKQLCRDGYAPTDIAIFYRWKTRKDEPAFQSLIQQLEALGLSTYWLTASPQAKRSYNAMKPGIRILTTLSSLGLEFKAVLLLWPEQFWDCYDQDKETAALARRQLYVAMTRAQDNLALFANIRNNLITRLEQGNTMRTKLFPPSSK